MFYVIIDPGQDYALYMMRFLERFGLRAVAVFTSPQEYGAFHTFWGASAGHLLAHEFLATEFPHTAALAHQIRLEVNGELHGIIPWAELTIDFGAELGEHLELDWNPLSVIRRFRNKFEMKEALRVHGGVRINQSAIARQMSDVYAFLETLEDWPVVVKPTEGAGSRGVFFAHSLPELEDAAQQVLQTGTGEVLLEEFIGGTEFVVNGITDTRGRMLVTDVWRYDKRDVGPLKNLYHQTLKVGTDEPMWMPLAVYATQVVHALGLRKAPVHMELKLDARGPCMIEVGARFAGGNQPLLASELHGRSLFELAACHYLADGIVTWKDVDYQQYNSRQARIVSGVQTEYLPQIRQLEGVQAVEALPSFYGFGKLLPVGGPAVVTSDLMTRSYEVYLLHPDRHQIENDAARVRALLHYH